MAGAMIVMRTDEENPNPDHVHPLHNLAFDGLKTQIAPAIIGLRSRRVSRDLLAPVESCDAGTRTSARRDDVHPSQSRTRGFKMSLTGEAGQKGAGRGEGMEKIEP